MPRTLFYYILVFLALGLVSCAAKKDSEKIGDAQYCMDHAEPSEAKDCLSGIEGLETKQAYYLRCAAGFLAEGLGETETLVSITETMEDNTDQMALLSILAFKSEATNEANQANAEATLSNCQAAGSSVLVKLATVANMSSVLAAAGDIDWSNPANTDPATATAILEAAAENSTPETQAAIGAAVISTYQSECAGKTTDDCEKINAAIEAAGGTDDPGAVGVEALCTYKPTLDICGS